MSRSGGVKFSIVTVCYNSAETVGDTINSVKNQSYQNYEHLIIDGLSSDGTIDLVNEMQHPKLRLVSEKDNGIYDAMNKGLRYGEGDVFLFLNSDDFFGKNDVLERVAAEFQKDPEADIVYSDIDYINADPPHAVTRKWRSGMYGKVKSFLGWHPPHPGFFISKRLKEKVGEFDLRYRIAADYDYMMRSIRALDDSRQIRYLSYVTVKMREGGASNVSLANILAANVECFKSNVGMNRFLAAPFVFFLKPFRKLLQLRQLRQ